MAIRTTPTRTAVVALMLSACATDLMAQTAIIPKHIWETIKDPATDVNKNPIGSGPYTLKSFTQAGVVLDERTGGYWQDLPKVKELRYVSYADNSAQATALANDEAEWSFVFIPNYQATFVSKDPKNHKVWAPGVLGIHGLYINTTVKPFDDPKLRQAMNMVVNRADIFHQAEAGYFHPQIDSVTGLPAGAGDAFVAPEYKGKTMTPDVEGAKALLQGAGYKLNGTTLITLTDVETFIQNAPPAPELVHVLGHHLSETCVRFRERLASFQAIRETKRVVQIARLAEPSGTLGSRNARLRVGARHEPDLTKLFVVVDARQ